MKVLKFPLGQKKIKWKFLKENYTQNQQNWAI